MKSPNWKEEELKLALELYLSKDLNWLSKMTDRTPEINALSQLLNQLNLFPKSSKYNKFRSCGSIRMKLSNFKALDKRYGKVSLSNVGTLDKLIWDSYYNKYEELLKECCLIVQHYFAGSCSDVLAEYLNRFLNISGIQEEFIAFAKKTYILADQFRKKSLSETNLELSQRMINTCFTLMKALEWCQNDQKACDKDQYVEFSVVKEHGGINQVPVNCSVKKIGKHVQDTMGKLIVEGKITQDIVKNLTSLSWSKTYLHLSHAFMIKIDQKRDFKEQLRDANGYLRYWKRTYLIGGSEYCICKEWFESGRKYFDKWVQSINSKNFVGMTREQLQSFLQFIKVADEQNVSIKREKLLQQMEGVDQKEDVLDKMIEKGLLNTYQGTERELVVDDYELLYDMIDHPEKYS